MSGPGSGMWYRWDRRTTVDEVKRLDVRWLHRQGYLSRAREVRGGMSYQ